MSILKSIQHGQVLIAFREPETGHVIRWLFNANDFETVLYVFRADMLPKVQEEAQPKEVLL